ISTSEDKLGNEKLTYSYVADPDDPRRITEMRCEDIAGVVTLTLFDEAQRVIQETITPPNDAIGRPRASDADNGGFEEPESITYAYTYSSCTGCASRPTSIVQTPGGRTKEYDYDNLTGLLLKERVMDPRGGSGLV